MINFKGIISLILLGFAVGFPTTLAAQNEITRSQATKYQKRTLVVVIPTQRKKIAVLKKAIAEGDASRRSQELLQRTIAEQSLWQKEIMRAVQNHYTFSKSVFLMDSVLHRDLELLPVFDYDFVSATLAREEAWFMVRGNLVSGAEALILQDERQQSLERPFPYYRKLNSISTLFESFFSSKKPRWKQLDLLIEKMNARLLKVVSSE